MREFRVLSPTAILGYGFPAASFEEGMRRKPHVIAVDAGSTDPGPYYLGSGKSFTDRGAVKRDMEFMLAAAMAENIPVIIGTAGGSGADSHLAWNVDIIKEIAAEMGLSFKMAEISAQIDKEAVKQKFKEGKLAGMKAAPAPTLKDIEDSTNIVAQMGHEPIIKALEAGAQVIITGRAYDPTVFAALAVKQGYDAGLALHMGKILECAAIAATPGSGSDCMFGYLRDNCFEMATTNPARKCTTTSVAAHTLYEKSDPTRLPGPGGVLDLTQTTFEQATDSTVIVRGSRFIPDAAYHVKLEGARLLGHRTISFAATTDPIMISRLDEIVKAVKERVRGNFNDITDFFLDFKVYGQSGAGFYGGGTDRGGVMPPEAAIIIEAVAQTPQLADTICSFARSTLLHFGYEGRKSTAGNLAFPFSPSDFRGGAVYEFSLYCLMAVDTPCEFFPVKIYDLIKGVQS
ncbi:MAG: DUF1446 domain-containing protein [Clostridiales bacterium]|jgi:hypothetical protein|nr:DUF1446 domain-containing protein [Clostridiales bacterium]